MNWWDVPTFRLLFKSEWRTAAVLAMIRQGYEHTPILADALEEAGCEDRKLLNYLRAEGKSQAQLACAYSHILGAKEPIFEFESKHMQEYVQAFLIPKIEQLRVRIVNQQYTRDRFYLDCYMQHHQHFRRVSQIDYMAIRLHDREYIIHLLDEMCRRHYRELLIQMGVDLRY